MFITSRAQIKILGEIYDVRRQDNEKESKMISRKEATIINKQSRKNCVLGDFAIRNAVSGIFIRSK